MKFADAILNFYNQLQVPDLPESIVPLLPFRQSEVKDIMEQFYHKFYHDEALRILLFGINPGRLGAGKTGVGFTDPVRLKQECGIEHHLEMKPEPSSIFMYDMINAFGGPEIFFKHFHFTSVCPIGFTRKGVNFNYYDTTDLQNAVLPFIKQCIDDQVQHPVNTAVAFCIGKGKNYKILDSLNQKHQWFERIEVLPHPRWILQYQRKNLQLHLDDYLIRLGQFR